jgi:hypothetical protein
MAMRTGWGLRGCLLTAPVVASRCSLLAGVAQAAGC